jgi:hypothetical protein
VLLNKDIGTDDYKASSSTIGKSGTETRTRKKSDAEAMSDFRGKQESNQGLCKVLSNSSKIQRNCPKRKNEDFLWT